MEIKATAKSTASATPHTRMSVDDVLLLACADNDEENEQCAADECGGPKC
jgi:hypothetical protein